MSYPLPPGITHVFPSNNGQPAENSPSPEPTSTEHLEALTLAIAQNRAVVYVGAGVSASAGLAAWGQLLEKLKKRTKPFSKNWDKVATDYFEGLFKKSKNLEAADWLDEILDSDLEQALWMEFGKRIIQDKLSPSAIHSNLARIPFSMAVTTNYDTLLEVAFKGATSLTWLDRQAILQALRDNRFVVLHSHGVIGNGPSLILTGTQYGDLMHANPRFGELLRWILTTRTCLFVGTALDDPDLIYQLRQGVAEYGSAFGPHYALLPADEAPQLRQTIIAKNLRINIIPVTDPEGSVPQNADAGKQMLCNPRPSNADWKTRETARFLRDLSGQVAQRKFELGLPQLPTSDDPLFYLYDALGQMLAQVCRLTGSFRGDFCLPVLETPEPPGKKSTGQLKYVISWGPTDPDVKKWEVTANSICGIAFYKATSELGVYLSDAENKRIDPECQLDLFGEINYKVGHTDVRSELAVPIEASGKRIGVLNLESELVDGYASGHRFVARKFAEKAGRLYAITRERERRGSRIGDDEILQTYRGIHELAVGLLKLVDPTADSDAFSFLVYHADFMSGCLTAQDPNGTIFPPRAVGAEGKVIPKFRFPKEKTGEEFPTESLAGRIFREGRPFVYQDADSAFSKAGIDDSYRKELEIKGALAGFPIVIRGHVGGVVVAWFRDGKGSLDGRHVDMFRRLTHLIVNVRSARQRELEIPFDDDAQQQQPAPILKTAEKVINALQSSMKISDGSMKDLDALGRKVWTDVGASCHEFLNDLSKQHDDFLNSHGREAMPDTWVRPLRCRCWVRERTQREESNDLPRFVLAFETRNDACQGVNQLDYGDGAHAAEIVGVAMCPEAQPKAKVDEQANAGGAAGDSVKDTDEIEKPAPATIFVHGLDKPVFVRLFKNNPHLSFLLSRARTRPFAFVQRPRVLGKDVMADILKKDKNAPWLVAPIIVKKEGDWSNGSHKESAEDRLVAFLTFDKPKGAPDWPDELHVENQARKAAPLEFWLAFQNDLLHQIDLFTAGISQRKYFRDLLKPVTPDVELRAAAASK